MFVFCAPASAPSAVPSASRRRSPQRGGSRVAMLPYEVAAEGSCEFGTFNRLKTGHMLKIMRVLADGEYPAVTPDDLIVALPVRLVYVYCSLEQLRVIAGQHGVSCSGRTLTAFREHLAAHQCGPRCLSVRLLVSRREEHERLRKAIEFRHYNVPRVSVLQDVSRMSTPITVSAATTSPSGPNVVPARRYVFQEPIVPSLHDSAVLQIPLCAPPPKFPPKPLPLSAKMETVRRWVQACSSMSFSESTCAVCARLVLTSTLSSVSLDDPCLQVLDEYAVDAVGNSPDSTTMSSIGKGLLREGVSVARNSADVCKECLRPLKKGRLPKLAMANGLWLGEVPDELRALNFAEKFVVARYRHNMCLITVQGGAKRMKANAVVYAQPVAQFQRVLPPTPSELADVMAIVFTGPCKPAAEVLNRAPLFIRKEVVLRALTWLKAHHSDYSDLEISHDNLALYNDLEPAVECQWIFDSGQTGENKDALAVYEEGDDGVPDNDEDGGCSFIVDGVCADTVNDLNWNQRLAIGIDHLKKGGKIMRYGHSGSPESIYHNPRLYPGMFPWLFPYGYGGFENELITVPVAKQTHIRYLLYHHDRRFQTDQYFEFLLYNQEQIRASSKGTFVLVEKRNLANVADKILGVDEEALSELVHRSKEQGYVSPESESERKCMELLTLIDNVSGHVAGSNTRKKWQRSEIKSMIYRYGMPVFFITFAPAEAASPICLYLCGEKVDLDSFLPIPLSENARVATTVRNPVACARFFDFMVNLFVKHVLRADSDESGIFGHTSGHYGTVEEQGRKTLHLHLLLWIAGSLSPEEIRERVMSSQEEFTRDLIEWLDSTVQGQMSDGSLDSVFERLARKGRSFGESVDHVWADPRVCIPKLPPDHAGVAEQAQWFKELCETTDEILALVNVHNKAHSHGCQKPPDFQCRARFPRDLNPLTVADIHDGTIRLKKCEAWMNTFNVVLTYLLRCNTDVTCLLSGTSVRAVVAYVTDYITKRNLKTHKVLSTVLAVFEGKSEIIQQSPSREAAARRIITKIVNALTSQYQVGGPAVCAELLGFPDHYTDKKFKVVFWQTYVREIDRSLNVRPDSSVEPLCDPTRNDHDLPLDKELVVLGTSGGQIVGFKRADDYIFRPEEFSTMSLYEYLQTTDVEKTKSRSNEEDTSQRDRESGDNDNSIPIEYDEPDDGEDDDELNDARSRARPRYRFIAGHPKHSTHCVVKTTKPETRVINFAGGLLPRRDVGDRDLYCKAMLTLFCPGGWRSGADLKESEESWESAFTRAVFDPAHIQIMNNMNLLYECQDARDDYSTQRKMNGMREALAPFLHGNVVDELDNTARQEQGMPDIDENGMPLFDMNSDLDLFQEGPRHASRRYQLSDMKALVTRDLAWDYACHPMNSGGVNSSHELLPQTYQDSRYWKNQMNHARDVTLASMGAPTGSGTGAHSDPKDANDIMSVNKVGAMSLHDYEKYIRTGGFEIPKTADEERVEIDSVSKHFTLNAEQHRAFMIMATHLRNSAKTPLRMYLGGMAGTGKSRVIDALKHYLYQTGEQHRIRVLAPTGAAAALLGGSTYHSVMGLGRGIAKTGSRLSKVRDRLAKVDLIIIDEVSMMSCRDLYDISEQMCLAFNLPLEAFAGRSVALCGDFAQLPPAGYGHYPLYSAKIGSITTGLNQDGQKNVMGKSLWHLFTTVVILRQNMRQRGLSDDDKHYRDALENMRYGRCTKANIIHLNKRVLGKGSRRSPMWGPKYKYVPVIVSWNTHRDAINEAMSDYFAADCGKELQSFYSVDRITAPKEADTLSSLLRENATRRIVLGSMPLRFQQALWDLPHGDSEHSPGTLRLCHGMPVMLKHNEATEIGATNGAEAVVVGWNAQDNKYGKPSLSTVFVRLLNPPRPIQLDGLPPNVIAVTAAAERITCRLPDDTSLSIMREQVPLLPNFAMTDYNSQGRTRTVNVVDLRNCRGAQSVYTCLSRSSSFEDTLILMPWSCAKVQSGIRADLLREMRELELLNDLTRMKQQGRLPDHIRGETRGQLLRAFQRHFGHNYVPADVHRLLRWDDATEGEVKVSIVDQEWRMSRGVKRKVAAESLPADERPHSHSKRPRTLTDRAEAHMAFTSGTVTGPNLASGTVAKVVRLTKTQLRAMTVQYARTQPDLISRSGILKPITWDATNWSCGYDCMLRLLLHLRAWKPHLWDNLAIQNNIVASVDAAFALLPVETSDLNCIRDHFRNTLNQRDMSNFPVHGAVTTAVDDLISVCFDPTTPYGQRYKYCERCGHVRSVRDVVGSLWSTGSRWDMRHRRVSVGSAELLAAVINESGKASCSQCNQRTTVKSATRLLSPPAFLALEVPAEDARFPAVAADPMFSMEVRGTVHKWELLGVVYLGHNHFTCLVYGGLTHPYFFDGMLNGGVGTVDLEVIRTQGEIPSGAKPCVYLYCLRSDVMEARGNRPRE